MKKQPVVYPPNKKKVIRKRSGKRGPWPEDGKSKAAGDQAGSGVEVVVITEKPAEKPAEQDNTKKAPTLLVEQPRKPSVSGERFKVTYLKPSMRRTVKGDLLLGFRMTLPLEPDHKAVLPKLVVEKFRDVSKRGCAGIKLKDVPAQKVEFFLDDISKDAALELPVAKFLQGHIDLVQRKGEGESRKVIRLSYVLQVPVSDEVLHFAGFNCGAEFWIRMTEVEPDLLELDDEEDED